MLIDTTGAHQFPKVIGDKLLAHVLNVDEAAHVTGQQVLSKIHPDDQEAVKQVLGALTFSSNWLFLAAQSDYFSSTAPELFRNSWLDQIVINDKEIHTSGGFYGVEYDGAGTIAIGFVPIVAGGAARSSLAAPARAGMIEIEIAGATMRVGPGVDWRFLREVLQAVKAVG